MEKFFEIGNKLYKPVAKISGVILGLISLNVVGRMLYLNSGFVEIDDLGGGTGWFSFLYVIFWIAFVALALSGIFVALRWFLGANKNTAAAPQAQTAYAPAQNTQGASQQTATVVCPVCGSSVPAGSPFCTNCGNKIN